MNGGYHRETARGTLYSSGGKRNSAHLTPQSDSGAQIQNVSSARVYVFGDQDVAEDEVLNTDTEMYELRARGKSSGQRNHVLQDSDTRNQEEPGFFEKTVQEEDTLPSIALKYGCQVAEIKRINNLITDQDFYALKIIKVPVRSHGVLNEILAEEGRNDRSSVRSKRGNRDYALGDAVVHLSEANEEEDDGSDSETRNLLVRTLSIGGAITNQGRDAELFLERMDRDINNIVSSTKSRKDTLEEVTDTLTCKRIHPMMKMEGLFSGIDCGMRWWSVVIAMLIIGLLLPLIYFVYYEYKKPPD